MKILLIDNYDSFTYNLVHYMEGFDVQVDVVYNDKVDLQSVHTYDKIVLSPGPGLPHEAGRLMEVISNFHITKPILGVCLGFQALVEFYGGSLYNQQFVKHGVAEKGSFNVNSRLFKNTATEFNIGLYHSWAANPENFPKEFLITGKSENDVIMAFEHSSRSLAGVQFHPESVLTEHGYKIVENFIFNFK